MKKPILFFSILLFIISFTSNAQISVALEGGVNLTSIENLKVIPFGSTGTFESRTGFYLGLVPKIELGEKFSINLEAQYSQEGYKLGPDIFEKKFHYVRALPQLEIKLFELLGIYGGYNFGFNISEEVNQSSMFFINPDLRTIKKTDSGFVVGGRIYLGKFSLTGKYNFGIKDINDLNYTDDNGVVIDVEQRNRNFQIGIGYQIF